MDMHGEIAGVAYELYEKKGRAEGMDLENWCEAERIVMARHAEKKNVAKEATTAQALKKTGRGVKGSK